MTVRPLHALMALLIVSGPMVSGCVSFIPTYDAAIYKKLEAVEDDLHKIDAAVGVIYAAPTPFEKVESYYVDAVANVQQAKDIAEGRRAYFKDRISGRPATLLAQSIDRCAQGLKLQMDRHKQAPIDRTLLDNLAVTETCAVARSMESRLNRGAK